MDEQDNRKPDWVKYYQVTNYEWDCPSCNYTNVNTQDPTGRVLRCFKCGSHFDHVRDGGYLEKGNY
jgi:ribosomal protein L37AE/L43A